MKYCTLTSKPYLWPTTHAPCGVIKSNGGDIYCHGYWNWENIAMSIISLLYWIIFTPSCCCTLCHGLQSKPQTRLRSYVNHVHTQGTPDYLFCCIETVNMKLENWPLFFEVYQFGKNFAFLKIPYFGTFF